VTTAAVRLPFPGHVLSAGVQDAASVTAVQHRLNQLGCGPIVESGQFGQETLDAVELFQARSVDPFNAPLRVDGRVGPVTWSALFGTELPRQSVAGAPLLAKALVAAAGEVGVLEDPIGSNRGLQVDQYLRAVGLDPAAGSFPWCAAFVYWCFNQAANSLNVANPLVKTAGVLEHWTVAGARGTHRLSTVECTDNPSLVQPGMIFVLTTGSGFGHTGLVEEVRGVFLVTIEGNTNAGGSREGIGVFRRDARRISDINRGFIDYR
jgi:hypothetical protein